MAVIRSEDLESLYELITTEEFPIDFGIFKRDVEELVDAGYIVRIINESQDEELFTCKPGLKFSDFSAIDSPLKKQILLEFIENPTTFFVLFNTQKGKSKITQDKLISWARDPKQIVSILMLDNDTTLGDQTIEGIVSRMKNEGVDVTLFSLSSTSKTTLDGIINYIDSYAAFPGKKPMPIITALSNFKQLEKILYILNNISVLHHTYQKTNLYCGIIWDEADRTYSLLRDKEVRVNGVPICIRNFTLDDTSILHGNGFITATDGSLIDGDYPECLSAHAFISETNPEDEKYYRAFHHTDSIIKNIKFKNRNKNNQNFSDIFNDNRSHFMTKITLLNGEEGFRKTIINSSARSNDMKKLAKELNNEGCHTMVFNQTGLTVYKNGETNLKRFKTKHRSFNELLYYAYKKCGLDTAPLFIIGRRKVDRGLGFHYAPRTHYNVPIKQKVITFDDTLGPLILDGSEGLIWTDEFLGHVENKETAVQKAGRLAGIIAQCPQYPLNLTWWTDEETASMVKRHYEIVDAVNNQQGCNTIAQAVERARNIVPEQERRPNVTIVDEDKYRIYDDEIVVKKVCKKLGYEYRKIKNNSDGFKETSLNRKKEVVSLSNAISKVPSTYSNHGDVVTWRTCLPCYLDITDVNTLRFVVIIRPETDINMVKEQIDTRYPSIPFNNV